MSLNFSQQASKKTPWHLSVSALAVERVLEYAVRQYAQFVILFSAQRDNAYRWIRLLERAGLLEFFHEATS